MTVVTPNFPIKSILVFSSRMDIREALKSTTQKIDFKSPPKLQCFAHRKNLFAELEQNRSGLLIIDWEVGLKEVDLLLSYAQKKFHISGRPTMIIAKQSSRELVGVSCEYHINKVHFGDISVQKIKELMEAIGKEEKLSGPLRKAIGEVDFCRRSGNWEEAEKLVSALKEKLPDNNKILIESAENLFNLGRLEEAIQLLSPLVELDPPLMRALNIMSRCYLKLKKYDETTEVLKRAKLVNPFNVERLLQLGTILLNKNQLEEAKTNFKEASKIDGSNKDAVAGQGKCLLLEGEINEALDLLQDISSDQQRASIFNTSAVLAIHRKDFAKGLKLYDSALTNVGQDQLIHARLLFNKGLGFLRWKKKEDAIDCFEQSIKFDPDFLKCKAVYNRVTGKEDDSLDGLEQKDIKYETDFDFNESTADLNEKGSPLSDGLDGIDERIVEGIEQDVFTMDKDTLDFSS